MIHDLSHDKLPMNHSDHLQFIGVSDSQQISSLGSLVKKLQYTRILAQYTSLVLAPAVGILPGHIWTQFC